MTPPLQYQVVDGRQASPTLCALKRSSHIVLDYFPVELNIVTLAYTRKHLTLKALKTSYLFYRASVWSLLQKPQDNDKREEMDEKM